MRQLSDQPDPPPAGHEDRRAVDLLVERWQRGIDRDETFHRIYVLYLQKVHWFFTRRGYAEDECMDLANEVFLRVHRALATFRRDSSFDTWIYKIALNVHRNRLRALRTQKRDVQEVPLDESAAGEHVSPRPEGVFAGSDPQGPLSSVLSDERARLLREAVEALPPQMRRCVLLLINDGRKYREIADLLHVSVETVKAHLYQARQQLKARLSDYFTDLTV